MEELKLMQQKPLVGKTFLKQAFTLLELMTVIVIICLLMTAAIPAFSNLVRNNQAIEATTRLTSSLRLAKGEAIKRGIPVTVCPISGDFNPTEDPDENSEQWPCEDTTQWDAWKVFVDPNLNATEDFSDGWPVIEYVSSNYPQTIFSNVSGPITFDPMGFANLNPESRDGWTWSSSYDSGEWNWNYAFASNYAGSYMRAFTISPVGCTGYNARWIDITQNGVINVTNVEC